MGFEVRSAIAFAGPPIRPNVHKAEAGDGAGAILGLEYGPAATIWRMNVGWRRRKKDAKLGFVLDTERGYWQRNDLDPDDKDDPLSGRTERVIPYVEDRRNVLLVTPSDDLSPEEMASLAAALKNAIQVEFQLEDAELAADRESSLAVGMELVRIDAVGDHRQLALRVPECHVPFTARLGRTDDTPGQPTGEPGAGRSGPPRMPVGGAVQRPIMNSPHQPGAPD